MIIPSNTVDGASVLIAINRDACDEQQGFLLILNWNAS